jgi:glycosyltransferase involved in cell wall biosynthesis
MNKALDRPMTVLQFGLTYAPKWKRGGPPRIMYDYARNLLREGFRMMVLTGDSNQPKPQDQWNGFPPGLEVHYCRKAGGWRGQYYFDYSWRELAGFFDRHWREIDFIHLYQTRSLFNVVALWAARKYGLKIVLSSFGSMPRRGSFLKYIYDQFFVLPMSRRAELLLGQTANECNVYREYGGRAAHIHLVPLAVDLESRPKVDVGMRRIFREKYAIAQESRLFVFVGRLHPTKGLEFLVNAFAKVAQTTGQAHLAIVGHDEGSGAEVQRLISEHRLDRSVTLCGPLFDSHRWQAYSAADSFVITPEVYEETSLASLEALACGTPVITNARADVPWLTEYQAGVVLPPGDSEAAVAAMLEVCRNTPGQLQQRREAANRLIAERFEIGAVTRQLAGLLRKSGPAH